ncbi:MAG TPA: RDD family protein [Chloroflexota bacterium]|nr:RDD family protein [Chloroflexota bacterium]
MTASPPQSQGEAYREGRASGAGGAGQDDYSVLTPERVSLAFDIAGIGSRAAAALIDTAIQAVLFFAVAVVNFLASLADAFDRLGSAGPWLVVASIILVALVGFFLLWGYYIVFEIVWSGQTPGKRALGIRVIRENGYPIRPGDAVVRNLVRIVDAPPFGAVLGSVVMLLNDRAKRLGDFAAGTIVVRETKRQRLDQLPGLPARPAALEAPPAGSTSAAAQGGATALALGADDATLLRDFLVRRREMYADARAQLARRLALHLSRRYGLAAPARGREEPFLESLASG